MQLRCHLGRQHGGDGFEDEHRRTGFLQGQCIVAQALGSRLALALHLVAAHDVHGLRRQAEVAADGDATVDEEFDGFRHVAAAFQLDHLGAGRHQRDGVAESLFRRFLVAAERHVGNDESAVRAAFDGSGMVGDVGDGHRKRGVVALDHIAQRIADQQTFNTGAVEQTGEAGVVGGEHDDLLAGSVELGEIALGQAAGDGLCGHLRPENEIDGA